MTVPPSSQPEKPSRYRRHYAAGERIFEAGEPATEAYIIESGRVAIRLSLPEGPKDIAVLGREALFGEMALLGDGFRAASAVAVEDTTVQVISKASFDAALAAADPFLRHLLRLSMERGQQLLRGRSRNERLDADLDDQRDRQRAWERLRFDQALEEAEHQQQFCLHYQAIVPLAEADAPLGFEALLRWERPGQGLVSPAVFVPALEASGRILSVGRWCLERACADAITLGNALGRSVEMAVNLSPRQLEDPALVPAVAAALAASGLAPARLKLEITESVLMSNFEAAQQLLEDCRALGVHLALDDFGTGYSSLTYLHRLPVDTLKLDRSFLKQVQTDDRAYHVVAGISRLASDLGMRTVAEGVENAAQAASLRALGIGYAQGCHFHPPAPLSAALTWLGHEGGRFRASHSAGKPL